MINVKKIDNINARIELQLMNLQITCLPDDDPIMPRADRQCCGLRDIGDACYDCPDLSWWWMGYDDKKPVCFATMKQSSQWTDAIYLSRSGVIPDYRGNGLQKKMISMLTTSKLERT